MSGARIFHWLGPLCLALLMLGGCTVFERSLSHPPENARQRLAALQGITRWHLAGRLAIRSGKRSWQMGVSWCHEDRSDDVMLLDPWGRRLGRLVQWLDRAVFERPDGTALEADDAGTLMDEELGWSLPFDALPDWMLGRVAASKAVQQQWDGHGRLRRLIEAEWHIDYLDYGEWNGRELPRLIEVRRMARPSERLRLVVEQWVLDHEPGGCSQ